VLLHQPLVTLVPLDPYLLVSLRDVSVILQRNTLRGGSKIDDSLDVFPVHGVGGILGTLLTATFAAESMGSLGIEKTIGAQFVVQLAGALTTIVWCGVITFIILKVLDSVIGLRVDEEEETEGLDLVLHDECGYNL